MATSFNKTETRHKKLSQDCVYGSSGRKRHEKYKSIVRDQVEEEEWKHLDVNEH